MTQFKTTIIMTKNIIISIINNVLNILQQILLLIEQSTECELNILNIPKFEIPNHTLFFDDFEHLFDFSLKIDQYVDNTIGYLFSKRLFNNMTYNDKKKWSKNKGLNKKKQNDEFYTFLTEKIASKFTPKFYDLEKHVNILYVNNNCTYEYITKVYNRLAESDKDVFLKKMLLSYENNHLILNNKELLIELKKRNILNKKIHAISWMIMYHKELSNNNHNYNYQTLFDLDTVTHLPVLDDIKSIYSEDRIRSVYVPTFIGNTKYYKIFANNKITKKTTNPFSTTEKFKNHLKHFITFKNFDIFEDINFKDYRMHVVGSCILACSQNHNDDDFHSYIIKNFNDSDIDLMFTQIDTEEEFYSIVIDVYDKICSNIIKYTNEDCHLEPINVVNYTISKDFLESILPPKYNIKDVNQSLCNNDDNLKKNLYDYYLNYMKRNNKISQINNYSQLNIKLKLNTHLDEHVEYYKKFSIASPALRSKLELFRVQYADHIQSVSRFHLPCVRGFYDGNRIKLHPSCVCAIMSNINVDYKFSMKEPIDIIWKYVKRGFGIVLNSSECKYLTKKLNDKYNTITITNYSSDVINTINMLPIEDDIYDKKDKSFKLKTSNLI